MDYGKYNRRQNHVHKSVVPLYHKLFGRKPLRSSQGFLANQNNYSQKLSGTFVTPDLATTMCPNIK